MCNRNKIDRQNIKRVLIISLSNIGDVILTFPVIDVLKDNFPSAEIFVVVGQKAKELFQNNPNISKVIIYDKKQNIRKQIFWLLSIRKEKFDIVIDLRHTAIPLFLNSRYKTKLIFRKPKNLHMREKHLYVLKTLFDYKDINYNKYCLIPSYNDTKVINNLLYSNNIENNKFVAIAPCAADYRKRWNEEGFARLADEIIDKFNLKIVFVGAREDSIIISKIMELMKHKALNICNQTTLLQLAGVFKNSILVISNDSASSHLASYLDKAIITLFAYTDPQKYGPWSSNCTYLVGKEGINSISSEDIMNTFDIVDCNVVFKK